MHNSGCCVVVPEDPGHYNSAHLAASLWSRSPWRLPWPFTRRKTNLPLDSLAIQASRIGVHLLLHAANTFGSFFEVGCPLKDFAISDSIPCCKHLGIAHHTPQIGAAKTVTGLRCCPDIGQVTTFAQELHGSSILLDVFTENFPLLPGLRQLGLQPELNSPTPQEHISHPVNILSSQDDHHISVLPLSLPARRQAVHSAKQKAEDVRASVSIKGSPAANHNVRVINEHHCWSGGLGCGKDLDDVGLEHHLANQEEFPLEPIRQPPAHGGLASAGLAVQ
mmetsp:Transcript_41951/g.99949  ORF Transcript_41951/g.99949 Transcript_41951/m.99949 type:complete len:278 (+) Transcript_41951:77-910(+)